MLLEKLGTSDLTVSKIGYGTYKLGGYGWPTANLKEANHLLETAYQEGINFFDTAPIYGHGLAEEYIGQSLSSVREKIVLATKCGFYFGADKKSQKDLSYDSIMWSVEGSLKRMKSDYIDLLQIHYYDNKTPFNEVARTLKRLKADNVVRYFGVSNCSKSIMKKAVAQLKIIAIQDEYSMVNSKAEERSLKFAREQGLGFIAYSPFAQGLFFEARESICELDVRKYHPLYLDREKYEQVVLEISKFSDKRERMLKFLLEKPGVFPIFSTTNAEHLKSNIKITKSLLEELK